MFGCHLVLTIRKPDKMVRYSDAIRNPDHSAIGRLLAIRIPDQSGILCIRFRYFSIFAESIRRVGEENGRKYSHHSLNTGPSGIRMVFHHSKSGQYKNERFRLVRFSNTANDDRPFEYRTAVRYSTNDSIFFANTSNTLSKNRKISKMDTVNTGLVRYLNG